MRRNICQTVIVWAARGRMSAEWVSACMLMELVANRKRLVETHTATQFILTIQEEGPSVFYLNLVGLRKCHCCSDREMKITLTGDWKT